MINRLLADIINPSIKAPLERAPNGEGAETFAKLFGSLWSFAIIAAGLAFLIFLIVGGIQWITAGGDKAHLENARDKITNGFIGLIVVLAAFVIVSILEGVLGIKILAPVFPTP